MLACVPHPTIVGWSRPVPRPEPAAGVCGGGLQLLEWVRWRQEWGR